MPPLATSLDRLRHKVAQPLPPRAAWDTPDIVDLIGRIDAALCRRRAG